MSELSEIKQLLQSHINASHDWRSKIDTFVGKIDSHVEHTEKKLDSHDTSIKVLQTSRERQNGALWLFGIIAAFFGFIVKIFIDIFKHG
jgi:hypothetical protein